MFGFIRWKQPRTNFTELDAASWEETMVLSRVLAQGEAIALRDIEQRTGRPLPPCLSGGHDYVREVLMQRYRMSPSEVVWQLRQRHLREQLEQGAVDAEENGG